jgi:hypothetical protein
LGYLKRELRGFCFPITEEPLVEVGKLMGEIPPEKPLDGLYDWIAQCESMTASDGNHSE